jgi:hypothetical protein
MILRSDILISFFEWILGMKQHGGIRAMALFPFILMPKSTIVDDELLNHERIHLRQQLELLVIPFYVWYLIELKRKGYYGVCFEREAYLNDGDMRYLKKRKPYSFLKYRWEKQ